MSDRRGPLDRRLWREVRSVRAWTAASVVLGFCLLGCLVVQAACVSRALAAAMEHDFGRIPPALWGLVAATVARAAVAYVAELAGALAAERAQADLRARALTTLLATAPERQPGERDGELAVALGQGLDRLDVYLGSYLPKMVLACSAPVVLVIWIGHLDLLSALILAFTLVLLPIFMILVGQATQSRVAKRWEALGRLSAQFLDAVTGLATLRAFGRAGAQRAVIGEATERLRRTTLATLRVAFLSGLVLEILASVGTALVALPLGLRLLGGRISLAPALAILVLTPEVYLPLRRASAEYHASTEGTAAAGAVLDVLGSRAGVAGGAGSGLGGGAGSGGTAGAGGGAGALVDGPLLHLEAVSVGYPGRERPALAEVTLSIEAGEHVALVGPSGAGKSSVAALALGLLHPSAGAVLVDGQGLADVVAWRRRVTWLPQRPTIFSGSVADNLRLGAPGATDAELWAALDTAGAAEFVGRLPDGLEGVLAEHGSSLSAGERQRIGLARALARRDADLFVLDEPTAHLDPGWEATVVDRLREVLAGRAALIVTHRPAPLGLADRVLRLNGGRLAVGGARDDAANGVAVGRGAAVGPEVAMGGAAVSGVVV